MLMVMRMETVAGYFVGLNSLRCRLLFSVSELYLFTITRLSPHAHAFVASPFSFLPSTTLLRLEPVRSGGWVFLKPFHFMPGFQHSLKMALSGRRWLGFCSYRYPFSFSFFIVCSIASSLPRVVQGQPSASKTARKPQHVRHGIVSQWATEVLVL